MTSALPGCRAPPPGGGRPPCRKPAPSPRPSRASLPPVSSHSSPPHGGPRGTNSALCAPVFPFTHQVPPPRIPSHPFSLQGPPGDPFPRGPGSRIGAGPEVGGGVGEGRPSGSEGLHPGNKGPLAGGAAGSSTRAGGTPRGRGAWAVPGWAASGPPPSNGAAPSRVPPKAPTPRGRAGETEAPGPRGVEGSGRKPGPTGGWRTVPNPGRAPSVGSAPPASPKWTRKEGSRPPPVDPEGGSRPPPSLCKVLRKPTVERGAL